MDVTSIHTIVDSDSSDVISDMDVIDGGGVARNSDDMNVISDVYALRNDLYDTSYESTTTTTSDDIHVNADIYALGVDLYYSHDETIARNGYINAIDDIYQSIFESSMTNVEMLVCFHSLNKSNTIMINKEIQNYFINNNKQIYLLFSEDNEGRVCGEKYYINNVGYLLQEEIFVTDIVMNKYPHWRTKNIIKRVTLLVMKNNNNDNEGELLFEWNYNPTTAVSHSKSSIVNNCRCAFHYPMDGVTLYPSYLNENRYPIPLNNITESDGIISYACLLSFFMDRECIQHMNSTAVEILLFFSNQRTNDSIKMNWTNPYFSWPIAFNAQFEGASTYHQVDLKLSFRTPADANHNFKTICSQDITVTFAKVPFDNLFPSSTSHLSHNTREEVFHPMNGLLFDKSRVDFSILLNYLQMDSNDVSVEIGTHLGVFSVEFLKRWRDGGAHICVDPWEYDDSYLDVISDDNETHQNSRYQEALKNLKPFGSRVVILRADSFNASQLFAQASVSFVYVDADHSYVGAMQDMCFWWPKIRHGGVLAGHDYEFGGNVYL